MLASLCVLGTGQPAPSEASGAPPGVALVGRWVLDPGRTHYGVGADRRRRERFDCAARGVTLTCEIDGERADGRRVTGHFATGGADGSGRVVGVPGIDAVRLRTVGPTIADATFSFRGAPVLAYRAYRGSDGRTLTIVAVDPVTRAALTSVVAYSRR